MSFPGSFDRPMRALVFLEASNIAGAVKPILEFAREATLSPTASVELTMVSYVRPDKKGGIGDIFRGEGVPAEDISERHPFDLRIIPQIQAVARRWRPDVIWTNNTKSHFLVRLSALHRNAAWVAFHHGYTKEAWRTRFYNELDRWSLRRAGRVVTVCNNFAAELQRKGVQASRIVVQRNPIRISPAAPEQETTPFRSRLGLPENATLLLCVGRLSREKGHADLLRAFSHLREAERAALRSCLLLVGDGPENRNLHALCAELRLDDIVRFAGYQADVRPYYAMADIFVLPSHSEGSPNVLLEAMAAELPMVATAVGGVPEVLSHEVNALLVPKGDVMQMAKAIRRLLHDAGLRQKFARNSHDIVVQHDPQSYFRNIVRVFEEVIHEASAA